MTKTFTYFTSTQGDPTWIDHLHSMFWRNSLRDVREHDASRDHVVQLIRVSAAWEFNFISYISLVKPLIPGTVANGLTGRISIGHPPDPSLPKGKKKLS